MESKRELKTGVISAIFAGRRFGFINPDEDNQDLFYHANSLLNYPIEELSVGDRVAYIEIEAEDGRKRAGKVRVSKSPQEPVYYRKPAGMLRGVIKKIDNDDRSGTIRTPDGNKFIFQESSLLNISFNMLKVGDDAEFSIRVVDGKLVVGVVSVSRV